MGKIVSFLPAHLSLFFNIFFFQIRIHFMLQLQELFLILPASTQTITSGNYIWDSFVLRFHYDLFLKKTNKGSKSKGVLTSPYLYHPDTTSQISMELIEICY